MANPNTLRTAAYLATRERLDSRRRTSGRVQCVAPNRVCGARCIPPEWDCRLKGEGSDPHLKAVGKGSDPVAGLANVERGFQRIGKGVTKLSFSEIEGGRRSLARGTAKLAPGDLKKKEDLKKKVDAFLGRVLLPATAIVGAGLLHKGMKNFRGYREGPGMQVEAGARSAINLVRTNIPGYGAQVRARQQAGPAAVGAMNQVSANLQQRGPQAVSPSASRRPVTRALSATSPEIDPSMSRLLNGALQSVDSAANNSGSSGTRQFNDWQKASLESFWSVQRNKNVSPGALETDGSVFTVHATNKLLSDSFGFDPPRGANLKTDSEIVIRNIANRLKQTGDDIRTSMREFGINSKEPAQVEAFIKRQNNNEIDEKAYDILVSAVTKTDYTAQAKSLYVNTAKGYDSLFQNVLTDIRKFDIRNPNPKELFYNDALQAHATYLNRRMQLPEPVHGSYTALLTRRAYYNRYAAGSKQLSSNSQINLSLTPTEAVNAGVEVARSRNIPEPETAAEALNILRRYYGQGDNALGSIQLVRATRQTGRARDRSNQPRRELTFSQRVAAYMRQRNPDGSPVYATREAAEAAARRAEQRRRRRDARVDAYLLVRNDFTPASDRKGKPCGKSFIPKNAKCSQPTSARYVDEPKKKEEERPNIAKTALTGAAIAGGAVLAYKGGRAAYRNRAKIKAGAAKFRKETIRFAKLPPRLKVKYAKYKMERLTREAKGVASLIPFGAINTMSSAQVLDGIERMPPKFRDQARKLVGKTKESAAYMRTKAQGFEPTNIDLKNNTTTWENKTGLRELRGAKRMLSNVDDILIQMQTKPLSTRENVFSKAGLPTYTFDFKIDEQFTQRTKGISPEQRQKVSAKLKNMWEQMLKELPQESIVVNTPYDGDGKESGRAAAYRRQGFNTDVDSGLQWAHVVDGKPQRVKQAEAADYLEELLERLYADIDDEDFD